MSPEAFFPYAYLGPRAQSAHAIGQAANAESRAGRAEVRVEELEERIDRLLLVCTALWSLVRETSGLTEEQLRERVREIDLSDGRLDGKSTQPPATCGSCGRVQAARHLRCIWCGAERSHPQAFDAAR